MCHCNVRVCEATLADTEVLTRLGRETFQESFGCANRAEDMAAHLRRTYAPAVVAKHLADPRCQHFLAVIEDVPAGFAKLLASHPPDCITGHAIEIHQMYVLQAFQKKKVGAALMRACIDTARLRQYDSVWLGVWDENERAQTFYRAWGFQQVGSQAFHLGADFQTDLVMKLDLNGLA